MKKIIVLVVVGTLLSVLVLGTFVTGVRRLISKVQYMENRIVTLEDKSNWDSEYRAETKIVINDMAVNEMELLDRLCRIEKRNKNCRFSY